MYSSILAESSSGILRITLNRPAQRNALSGAMITELTDAVKAAPRETRVLVLTGSGEEAFCAGADLAELSKSESPESRRAFFGRLATLISAMSAAPFPIIAKVRGFALAGGMGLVAASDIVIAAEDAVFGLPEVQVGLAAMVVMGPLERIIGPRALSNLLFTGERINADQALRIGLVNQVVGSGALDAEVESSCTSILKGAPNAIGKAKEALLLLESERYEEQLLTYAEKSALVSLGDEAKEGISAFLEKRKPAWRG